MKDSQSHLTNNDVLGNVWLNFSGRYNIVKVFFCLAATFSDANPSEGDNRPPTTLSSLKLK